MNFESLNDTSTIKNEDLKDEYDIFLFAHLDNITNNIVNGSNDLPFGNQMEAAPLPPSKPRDHLDHDMAFDEKEVANLDVAELMKFESEDADNGTTHFVRHEIQNGKQVKLWECGVCQKVFTHQYTLMRHLPTHTDERKFQCVTCGKAFRQMSTLSQHRAIHSTDRPYICEICQKTFNRVSTLISHRKTHTGLKPHRCHLCTKAFHQKGNLRNHIFTHTNERPYKCDICGNGYNQMSNLMCHKLKAHQKSEKLKYECHVCFKSFAKRVSLRQHERYTHVPNTTEAVVQPTSTIQIPDKISNANSIIVEPIKTEAMRLAIESNQTPFALLRPVSGIPVLVRVLPAGDKQMLVPASAEDLKKHSQISIMAKDDKIPITQNQQTGCTVQIKIPVVATVIQRSDLAGQLSMSVISPGPNGELGDQIGLMGSKINNFVYSSTLTQCGVAGSHDLSQNGTLSFINQQDLGVNGVENNHIQISMDNGIAYQTIPV
ncbi:unnamed protein product [Phyllotreta striolata]|uniref:C2H2-type domain-containing protein n=1 Tax=Phyllotreta striolata TaxID=444603 RepID=A0A9N9TGJ0_PHYSR|nr:unnamed protein product [Phyllotreta striolata]